LKLDSVLFFANESFHRSLVNIRSCCYAVCETVNKEFVSLIDLELFHTYTLNEFHEAQLNQCKRIKERIKELRASLVVTVFDGLEVCKLC